MGYLVYGNGDFRIHFDDRTLTHMKAVVISKLRRQEGFTLSWRAEPGEAMGRSTLWMHPSIPLQFEFDEAERPKLNRA